MVQVDRQTGIASAKVGKASTIELCGIRCWLIPVLSVEPSLPMMRQVEVYHLARGIDKIYDNRNEPYCSICESFGRKDDGPGTFDMALVPGSLEITKDSRTSQ